MKEKYQHIEIAIVRPSVEKDDSYVMTKLANLFLLSILIDKTVCEDRIIYVFKTKK